MAEMKEKTKKTEVKLDTEEMAKAGLHFGHRTSRIHPRIQPYLFGVRGTVHIIDLEKTKEKFQEALDFIKELSSQGKVLLLVGTKVQAKELVKQTAKDCGLPYVAERWLGGALTNFEVMKKRVERLKELEKQKESGELEKYTKKERAKIDQEIELLEKKFGGLKELERLPDAVFVLDMKKDALAVKEAKAKGIPVVAIADTNVDPTLADCPIPANDDATSSVRYILERVKETVLKSKPKEKKEKEKEK